MARSISAASGKSKIPAHLEHSARGRVHVRVPPQHRSRANMTTLRRRIRSHPSVSAVAMNEGTGSIVVQGSPGKVRDAVDEFLEIVDEGGAAGEAVGVGTAVGVVKALDRRVQAMTGHRLRLRFLVPATFFGLGIRALIVDGLTVGTLPWFVLVYFGIDSFLKLYPEHAPAKKTSG